jgi:hypothetical protein
MNKGSFWRPQQFENTRETLAAKLRFRVREPHQLRFYRRRTIMTNKMKILPALALAGAMAIAGTATPALAAHGGGFGGFHGGGFHGGGFRGGGWGHGWGGGWAGLGAGLALGGALGGWGYPYYGYYDYPYDYPYYGYGGCVPHRYWWHGHWNWRAC